MIERFGFTSFILFVAVFGPVIAFAQSPETDDHQACITNVGSSGVLFRGHMHTLVGPEVFGSIRLTAEDGFSYTHETTRLEEVHFIADSRFGNQIQVFAAPFAKTERRTVIEFLDPSGKILESCFVVVVEYDASIYDLSETVVGYCDFGGRSGVTNMKVGESRTFDLPEKYRDGASPFGVLEYRPEKGWRKITFTAKSQGLAFFAWLGKDIGNGMLRGVCPFIVTF